MMFTCAVVATVLLSLAVRIKNQPTTHTKTFCAYGRVFVEFDEEGKRWGTLMLDMGGKPIRCQDDVHDNSINDTI